MLSAGVRVSGSPLCGQNKDMLHPLAVPAPQADLGLQAVLICGWQDTPFMLELLTDLDRGVDKLPRGSEVVLLNAHDTEEISKHVKRLGALEQPGGPPHQGQPPELRGPQEGVRQAVGMSQHLLVEWDMPQL